MNKQKRDLLKVISAAGAAGAVWTKPVINGVVLPAHAELSPGVVRGGGGGNGDITFAPLLNTFIPAAHAVGNPFPGCAGFEWSTGANEDDFDPTSVRLLMLARECKSPVLEELLSNSPMTQNGPNSFETSGNGFDVTLFMDNPFAGPGQQFGTCNVNSYLSFDVFRGESCEADVPSCLEGAE